MTVYYTGVGSRETPVEVLARMTKIARHLTVLGYVLRSGGAIGADSAFERGAGSSAHVYLAWPNYKREHPARKVGACELALQMASTTHPAWGRLSEGARLLHARNCYQVLGDDLKTPSSFLVCWTPDGCVDEAGRSRETGGTATAIVLAARNGIPVFNLQVKGAIGALKTFLKNFEEL